MLITIRSDSVEIEGYVNAVERKSKPLWSRIGQFVERICKGAFFRALERNDDVKILLNHNPERVLGSQKQGNLELHEDSIGLHARATITDPEVIELARAGDLVGWSFGFYDREVEQKRDENGYPLRDVVDLDLEEVSILDKRTTPAYDGTLVSVRSEEKSIYYSEHLEDDIQIRELQEEPAAEDVPKQQETVDKDKHLEEYQQLLAEMKA